MSPLKGMTQLGLPPEVREKNISDVRQCLQLKWNEYQVFSVKYIQWFLWDVKALDILEKVGENKRQCMLTMNGLLDMPGPAMGCPKGVMEGLF